MIRTYWGFFQIAPLSHHNALYNYDEAVSRFGNKLPSKKQFEELKNNCTWTWTGNGYRITGPNGNSINLPALGARLASKMFYVQEFGYYWSATRLNRDHSYHLRFFWGGVSIDSGYYSHGFPVRLVQNL